MINNRVLQYLRRPAIVGLVFQLNRHIYAYNKISRKSASPVKAAFREESSAEKSFKRAFEILSERHRRGQERRCESRATQGLQSSRQGGQKGQDSQEEHCQPLEIKARSRGCEIVMSAI
jgi:hypothetical protein